MRLKNKKAIVTGGASGFGEGIVRKFVAEGATVLIADLNLNGAQALADELGAKAKPCKVNVADGASVSAMVKTAMSELGGLDVLINNAGTTHLPNAMEDITETDFDKVFAVNCKSVFLTAQQVVPIFKEQKGGVKRHGRGISTSRHPG